MPALGKSNRQQNRTLSQDPAAVAKKVPKLALCLYELWEDVFFESFGIKSAHARIVKRLKSSIRSKHKPGSVNLNLRNGKLTFKSLLVTCTNKFNIQQLYALPTLYLCVLYLFKSKQLLVPLTA
jgi:hypothetical protein